MKSNVKHVPNVFCISINDWLTPRMFDLVSSWRQNYGSKPTFCFHWTSGPVPEAVTHNYSSVPLWVWNESESSLYASPQIGLEMCALDSDGAFSRGRPNTTGGQTGKLGGWEASVALDTFASPPLSSGSRVPTWHLLLAFLYNITNMTHMKLKTQGLLKLVANCCDWTKAHCAGLRLRVIHITYLQI